MEPLTLYFDRNVGKRLPEALRLLHLDAVKNNVVHHHSEKRNIGLSHKRRNEQLFPPEEKDDVWLTFVGEKRWIVFSQDRKFHHAGFENELYAIKHFNIGCFYLWGAAAPTAEKARVFLTAYPRILKAIKETPKPFIFDITKGGKLRRMDI